MNNTDDQSRRVAFFHHKELFKINISPVEKNFQVNQFQLASSD